MKPVTIILISIVVSLLFTLAHSDAQQISTTILEVTLIVMVSFLAIAIENLKGNENDVSNSRNNT